MGEDCTRAARCTSEGARPGVAGRRPAAAAALREAAPPVAHEEVPEAVRQVVGRPEVPGVVRRAVPEAVQEVR